MGAGGTQGLQSLHTQGGLTLVRIAQGATQAATHLTLTGGAHGSRKVCASAQIAPDAGQFLLTFTDWPTP